MKDEILRVNHAGETAAKYIYKTQLKLSRDVHLKHELKEMYLQEKIHLEYFINELREHNIRPTALMPLWKFLSRLLGAGSAVLGKKYVMLTTEAVEEVIDNHYQDQLLLLERFYPEEKELYEKIKQFRQDEIEHRNKAQQSITSYNTIDYLFSTVVKKGCQGAIFLSKLF